MKTRIDAYERFRRRRLCGFEKLEHRRLLAGDAFADGPALIVSEFMADNDQVLLTRTRSTAATEFTGNLTALDWVELTNLSADDRDLGGLHLTDDANDLTKWQFPEGTDIRSGEQLVVFASGLNIHDRSLDEQGLLHTNFRLGTTGEYLAITDNHGVVIHEYASTFPPQKTDISFGVSMDARSLVGPQSTLDYLVPSDDSLAGQWQLPGFVHAEMVVDASGPIGFGRAADAHEPGETVGAEVAERASTQSATGAIVVLQSAPFTVTGRVVDWSFFSATTNSITPLIVKAVGSEFAIVGTGRTRTSDASGAQSFAFDLQSGTDHVDGTGYFFAYKDGDNESDNNGVTQWGRSTTDKAIRFNGPHIGNLTIGRRLSEGRELDRAYSVQATTVARLAGPINTDVDAAMTNATSLYVRYPFSVPSLDSLASLKLVVRYEDGFVAYLNGTQVAQRNVPERVAYDAIAEANRPLIESNRVAEINLSQFIGVLNDRDNVLALHALDDSRDSTDFLIDAQLVGVGIRSLTDVGYTLTATPGRPNDQMAPAIGVAPTFSVSRGIYDQPFELQLGEASTPDTKIYYTTDGTVPSRDNPHAVVYDAPIVIDRTTVLRAINYQAGALPSSVESHTYVFPNDVVNHPDMDPLIVDDPIWGPQIPAALKSLPTISVMTLDRVNTDEVGTSLELIYPDGSKGFQIDAGVEAYGGTSLGFLKQSLRFSFKDRYGPSKLKFDVFDDPTGVTEFDQLLLRSGAHDTMFWPGPPGGGAGSYIRNRWAFDRQIEMGQPAPRGRFVHVYHNGQYRGVFELAERPNGAFMASHFGGDAEDYDALNAGNPVDGDRQAWQALIESVDDGYDEVQKYLDVENYADYMLLQFFGGNDWDWNAQQNWMAARKREPNAGFKFFAWDSDVVLRTGAQRNVVALGGPSNLWTVNGGVQQYDDFRSLLADRAEKYFGPGGMFSSERLRNDIDELADRIRIAIVPEVARWGGAQYTPDTWQRAIDWIKDTYAPTDGPSRAETVVHQMQAANLIPTAAAPRGDINDMPLNDGVVQPGDALSFVAQEGVIYYTLDGSDPRQAEPTVAYSALISDQTPVRFLIPTDDSIGTQWRGLDFDDSIWTAGVTGIGFDANNRVTELISTDIQDEMRFVNSTAYLRIPFQVDDPNQFQALQLSMRFDDGFVVYLNGQEVVRRNAPADLEWDARATRSRFTSQVVTADELNLSQHLGLLRPGANVLAIHAMNRSASNSDFVIAPELRAGTIEDAGVSDTAVLFTEPIVLPPNTTVKARTVSSEWSAVFETATPSPARALRVSEVMYHPAMPSATERAAGMSDREDFEFIELVNTSDDWIDLDGVRLTSTIVNGQPNGVDFDFGESQVLRLAPDQRVVIVENRAAFEVRYGTGLPVAGEWRGGLNNNSERITLTLKDQVLQEFTYRDVWHAATDGIGSSLEILNASHADLTRWNHQHGWRPSTAAGGTPGRAAVDAIIGDSNGDGVFDSFDLDTVFSAGEYEDAVSSNSTFAEGDWNGDGDFTSEDLVFAFRLGIYEVGSLDA